jgi:hypothetical protein
MSRSSWLNRVFRTDYVRGLEIDSVTRSLLGDDVHLAVLITESVSNQGIFRASGQENRKTDHRELN